MAWPLLRSGDSCRVHGSSVANGLDGFQCHVAAGDGPLVVLFEYEGADQAGDGGLVWEDTHDIGSAFDWQRPESFALSFKRWWLPGGCLGPRAMGPCSCICGWTIACRRCDVVWPLPGSGRIRRPGTRLPPVSGGGFPA